MNGGYSVDSGCGAGDGSESGNVGGSEEGGGRKRDRDNSGQYLRQNWSLGV